MSAPLALWARDLLAYSAQLAVVLAAASVLSLALRMREPRVKLAFAQGLFALALALPWMQPRAPSANEGGGLFLATGLVAPTGAHTRDPWPIAGGLLALGAIFRLAVLGRRLWKLRRCRRLSRPLDPLPVAADACARVGVEARVCVSEEIAVPAAFGAWRPVVLVPPRFGELGPDAQRAVLCHELVHVRRRDWLQMLVEEIAAAVLWFHPGVWWLLGRLRLAREQVVDQEAVRLTRERRVYLETLVALARQALPLPAPAPLFLRESHLERRVDVLLKEVTMSKARAVTVLAAGAAGVLMAGAAAVRGFPLEVPAPPRESAGAATPAKKTLERKRRVKVDPAYPPEAKKAGIEGDVVLDVLITAAGDVEDVKVAKGPSELRGSATRAVEQWKFEAGPHDTRATLTIRYALDK